MKGIYITSIATTLVALLAPPATAQVPNQIAWIKGGHAFGSASPISWSADGTRIYTPNWKSNTVSIWNSSTGQFLGTVSEAVGGSAIARQADKIVGFDTVNYTGKPQLYDLKTGANIWRATVAAVGSFASIDALATKVASGGSTGVSFYQASNGTYLGFVPVSNVLKTAFSDDGTKVAAYTETGVTIIDASMLAVIAQWNFAFTAQLNFIKWSHDGQSLLISRFSDCKIYDPLTGSVKTNLNLEIRPMGADFSPNDRYLSFVSGGSTWKTLDLTNSTAVFEGTIDSPGGSVAFSPDGQTVAVDSLNGNLTIRDLFTGQTLRTIVDSGWDTSPVIQAAAETYVKVWTQRSGSRGGYDIVQTRTGQLVSRLDLGTNTTSVATLSPHGDLLLAAMRVGNTNLVRLVSKQSGTVLRDDVDTNLLAYELLVSPDGQYYGVSGQNGDLSIKKLSDGSTVGHFSPVSYFAWGPDSQSVIFRDAALGRYVRRDVSTGATLWQSIPLSSSGRLSASPDYAFVAAGISNSIKTLRSLDGTVAQSISVPGQTGYITWKPDGKKVLTSISNVVREYTMATGNATVLWTGPKGGTTEYVHYSKDGRMAVVLQRDGSAVGLSPLRLLP